MPHYADTGGRNTLSGGFSSAHVSHSGEWVGGLRWRAVQERPAAFLQPLWQPQEAGLGMVADVALGGREKGASAG